MCPNVKLSEVTFHQENASGALYYVNAHKACQITSKTCLSVDAILSVSRLVHTGMIVFGNLEHRNISLSVVNPHDSTQFSNGKSLQFTGLY